MGRNEPIVVKILRQDDHHSLFIGWLVELLHQRMLVRIDGQHSKTVKDLALGLLPPGEQHLYLITI